GRSQWRCTWEERYEEPRARLGRGRGERWKAPESAYHFDRRRTAPPGPPSASEGRREPARGSIRLGLRYVRGLRRETGERILEERRRRPFDGVDDLALRARLDPRELERLALAGALASLEPGADGRSLSRREALWQVARVARPAGPLFAGDRADAPASSPLPEMSPIENTWADFRATGLTVGPHPMAYTRAALRGHGVVSCARLERLAAGRQVRFAGSVIVRQRPGTAKGMLFVTLEDETGMAQAIIRPDLLQERRDVIVGSGGLVIEGQLQRRDGSLSVRAEKIWPLDRFVSTRHHPAHSHDWH
ncbi:MAG: hypothetical protein MI919_23465, partial [Holophagales bacterium]|nr:hypothetical protein [Holophagales bacterium]